MIGLNENNTYLYMTIPYDYKCVYDKLLKLMSNLGTSLLYNCNTSCKSSNKNLIRCWNMFQTACAAYTIDDIKKADIIIRYIDLELNLGCRDSEIDNANIIYFGEASINPTIDDIVNGNNIRFEVSPIFEASFYNIINYIAVPQGVIISTIENSSFNGDFLYSEFTGTDIYNRSKISINEEDYLLWTCELVLPLNSNVKVSTRKGVWQ